MDKTQKLMNEAVTKTKAENAHVVANEWMMFSACDSACTQAREPAQRVG